MIANEFRMLLVSVSGHGASIPQLSSQSSAPQYSSYGGYQGTSKKIEIPNGRVSFLFSLFSVTEFRKCIQKCDVCILFNWHCCQLAVGWCYH
jgi:hypothetical protein